MPERTYTYRRGRRLPLEKEPDEIVTRVAPDTAESAVPEAEALERVSAGSTRVHLPPERVEEAMARLRAIGPTHHAYRQVETGDEFLITDRVLVTFTADLAPEEIDRFAADWSLVALDRFSDRDFLFQLTDHTGMNPVKLVVKLVEEDDRVEAAENDVNQRVSPAALALPTDPHYLRQWYLHRRYEHAHFDPRASTGCEDAWKRLGGFGSPDIVVGVTDDGCKLDHPDFGAAKFAGWAYFRGTRLVVDTDLDANPAAMYDPGEDHGTSCAGVIAGGANGVLSVGAAPGVRLLPIKWEIADGFLLVSDSKLLRALGYAANRVDVLSSSWSRSPSSLWAGMVLNRITELARNGGRRGKGILFLWAGGNHNCPLRHSGTAEIPYSDGWVQRPDGSWSWEGPARSRRFENDLVGVPGVAHVAAVASTGQRSHYSNYGPGITLSAPSSNSHAYYRLTVAGLGVTTASGEAGGVTHTFGGTSSATPLVAGVAALVLSANPNLSAKDVLSILNRTASKDLRMDGYPRTPPAAFDANPTWDVSPVAPYDDGAFLDAGDADGTWSPWFGHGRVDARAAVDEALRMAGGGTLERDRLERVSRPRAVIPDDDRTGIRDGIEVDWTGAVGRVEVELDIRHPRIGDLYIRLIAPGGTAAVLHRRGGGDTDDIRRSYDSEARVALSRLVGGEMKGTWTLEVRDHAGGAGGTLEAWWLRLEPAAGPLRAVDTVGGEIPDADPRGIVRTVGFPPGRPIRTVTVGVEIVHPWTPDLAVRLIPPGDRAIALPIGRIPFGQPLIRAWSSEEEPQLAVLRGRDPGGTWSLHVADLHRSDVGRLHRWSIEIAG